MLKEKMINFTPRISERQYNIITELAANAKMCKSYYVRKLLRDFMESGQAFKPVEQNKGELYKKQILIRLYIPLNNELVKFIKENNTTKNEMVRTLIEQEGEKLSCNK